MSDHDDLYVCCDADMVWDAERRGFTCGGLELIGWMTCRTCDVGRLVSRHQNLEHHSRVPSASNAWAVAKGGRSVLCGGVKLRAEKCDAAGLAVLLERIAALPDLEAEVERLRAELGYRRAR